MTLYDLAESLRTRQSAAGGDPHDPAPIQPPEPGEPTVPDETPPIPVAAA